MKKTISVNLNGQVFYLNVDAYDKLEKYLESIKEYFQSQESKEVVDDIEARIAEKFCEIIGKSKNVIQISDVEKIIKEMGSVDDIADADEEKEIKDETEKIKKKLFRDPETKILTGVASGLGWYFGIKSIFVRIAFAILFINPSTTWLAVVGYIAAWLLVPEVKTSWEKLEMKGKPTTVNELQTAIEEKTSTVVSNIETKTRNIIQKIFSIFGRLIKFFGILFCRLTGFFSIIFNILLIMAISVGMVFVYLHPNIPYFDFSFIKTIGAPWLEIAYVAFGLIFIIPLIFVIDLSDSLMRLKWKISTQKIIMMLIIWISSVILAAGIGTVTYPKYKDGLNTSIEHLKYLNHIDESNNQTLKVGKITKIDISSIKEVKIIEGNENEVKIIGSKHDLQEITSNYENGLLTVKGKNEEWFGCHDCISYVSSVRIEIKTNHLDSLKLDNNIDAWYYPTNGNINIEIGKLVGLKVEGKLNQVVLKSSSYSVINLLDATINQIDANLETSTLKTEAKIIKIKGDNLSTLIYQGSPQTISQEGDQTVKQKYILSEDREKIKKVIANTYINVDGIKKKISDYDWPISFETQSDYDFYDIFTAVKSKDNSNKVYVLWLTEKDGIVALKNSVKIDGWEKIHYFNLFNDKFLRINGQIYDPKLKEKTVEIYIDKTKGILQIQPETNLEM